MGAGSSSKVTGKSYVFTKTHQMASIGAIFTSTSHKAAKFMAKLISQSYSELQPTVCLPRDMQPFEGNPSTHGHLTSLRNESQQNSSGNFQHQYLPELLINIYNHHLMVKSVSCYCVRGSRLFSNPVTYIDQHTAQL